jgi:hypothetical protein
MCFRWFAYFGNEADSEFVPFQINYIQISGNNGVFDPLRIETKSCSEPYDVSSCEMYSVMCSYG